MAWCRCKVPHLLSPLWCLINLNISELQQVLFIQHLPAWQNGYMVAMLSCLDKGNCHIFHADLQLQTMAVKCKQSDGLIYRMQYYILTAVFLHILIRKIQINSQPICIHFRSPVNCGSFSCEANILLSFLSPLYHANNCPRPYLGALVWVSPLNVYLQHLYFYCLTSFISFSVINC